MNSDAIIDYNIFGFENIMKQRLQEELKQLKLKYQVKQTNKHTMRTKQEVSKGSSYRYTFV